MSWKQWLTGELVRAADFQSYVQDQVVSTFPDAATRDAVIIAPVDGQTAYLTTPDELTVWTGAAWKTLGAAGRTPVLAVKKAATTDASNGLVNITAAEFGVASLPGNGAVANVAFGLAMSTGNPQWADARINATSSIDVRVFQVNGGAVSVCTNTSVTVHVLTW